MRKYREAAGAKANGGQVTPAKEKSIKKWVSSTQAPAPAPLTIITAERDRAIADRDLTVARLAAASVDRDRAIADRALCAPGLTAVIADRDRAVARLGERDDVIAEVTCSLKVVLSTML